MQKWMKFGVVGVLFLIGSGAGALADEAPVLPVPPKVPLPTTTPAPAEVTYVAVPAEYQANEIPSTARFVTKSDILFHADEKSSVLKLDSTSGGIRQTLSCAVSMPDETVTDVRRRIPSGTELQLTYRETSKETEKAPGVCFKDGVEHENKSVLFILTAGSGTKVSFYCNAAFSWVAGDPAASCYWTTVPAVEDLSKFFAITAPQVDLETIIRDPL